MPARDELRVSLGATRPWCWLGLALTAAGALELLGGALLIRALVGPPWSTALETVLAVTTPCSSSSGARCGGACA